MQESALVAEGLRSVDEGRPRSAGADGMECTGLPECARKPGWRIELHAPCAPVRPFLLTEWDSPYPGAARQ